VKLRFARPDFSRIAISTLVVAFVFGQSTPPALCETARGASTSFTTNASWYGGKFHGRRTASGQRFDQNQLTAASPNLPFGTRVLVKNPKNGRTCSVVINDRGPFTNGRGIDLSRAAARQLGISGVSPVICYADRSAPGGYRYVRATRTRSGGYNFRIVRSLIHVASGTTRLWRHFKRAIFAMF